MATLHLKDMDATPARGITSLGRGIIDFKAVLAAAGALPFLTSVLAAIGIISGLRVFLPRVTTKDKVLISMGVAASLLALVLLLLRL